VRVASDAEEANMPIASLEGLFHEELKDLYSVETQQLEALPRMIDKAGSKELQQALKGHLEVTRKHKDRLEEVSRSRKIALDGKTCKGIAGIIRENEEILGEVQGGGAVDAALIASGQRVEHYEISGYGTARAWAEEMGHTEAVSLLARTLDEEAAADEKLTSIAVGGLLGEGVNEEAEKGVGERTRTKSATKKKASAKRGGKRANKAPKKSSKKKAKKKATKGRR
jgi:ferritin-like metal-binding protein YciE